MVSTVVASDGRVWEAGRYMYRKPHLVHEADAFFSKSEMNRHGPNMPTNLRGRWELISSNQLLKCRMPSVIVRTAGNLGCVVHLEKFSGILGLIIGVVEIAPSFIRLSGKCRVSLRKIESPWNGGSTIQALGSAPGITTDSRPQARRSSQNCD